MPIAIRPACDEDASELLAIYAPALTESAISFESEPPSPAGMARRVRATLCTHPWLVWEAEGRVAGFAHAARHRMRDAYRSRCRPTCDQRPGAAGWRAGVGIALPKPASVALHEATGFKQVGIYRGVGYKLGGWRDVGWWQLELKPREVHPREPRPFAALLHDSECVRAMAACAKLVR